MGIIKIRRKEIPYAQIEHAVLNRADMSYKAKGIYAYLIAKPVDWEISISDLCNHATDGADAVATGLQELENLGYTVKKPRRNARGHFEGYDYDLYEQPVPVENRTGNGKLGYGKKARKRGEKPAKPAETGLSGAGPDAPTETGLSGPGLSGPGLSGPGKSGTNNIDSTNKDLTKKDFTNKNAGAFSGAHADVVIVDEYHMLEAAGAFDAAPNPTTLNNNPCGSATQKKMEVAPAAGSNFIKTPEELAEEINTKIERQRAILQTMPAGTPKHKAVLEEITRLKNDMPVLLPFKSIDFTELWDLWKSYKVKNRHGFKDKTSEQAALADLYKKCGGNEYHAMCIINKSMVNTWRGLFELKADDLKYYGITTNNYNGQYSENNQYTDGGHQSVAGFAASII